MKCVTLLRLAFVSFGMSGVLIFSGCGTSNELGRRPVSGQVTLKGHPLDKGTVRFVPQDAQGVASGATVQAGKFAIAEEQGLPPGSYRVQLSSAGAEGSGVDPNAPPGESQNVAKELIPPAFNRQSNLVVEVAPDGDNHFEFAVP